jgi:hypothetical protein
MSLVFQAVGELAHEMDAQSTYNPFIQRFRRIGLRYFQRIERLRVIFHFDSYLSGFNAKPHRDLVFAAVDVTIGDDVCEKFPHDEVEVVQNALGQSVSTAKFRQGLVS